MLKFSRTNSNSRRMINPKQFRFNHFRQVNNFFQTFEYYLWGNVIIFPFKNEHIKTKLSFVAGFVDQEIFYLRRPSWTFHPYVEFTEVWLSSCRDWKVYIAEAKYSVPFS